MKKRVCVYAVSLTLLLTGCKLVPNANNKYVESTMYYTKGNKEVNFDDIVLTMYEKDNIYINDLGKEYINNIEKIKYKYDTKWIDILNINKDSLTDKYVVNSISKHSNTKYYNSSNNSIKWDKLIDVIYINSKNREKNSNNKYISLSKDEIKIILSQMNDFLDIVLKDYPSFDVSNLACKLNNLSLVYYYIDAHDKAKASCIYDMISIGIEKDNLNPDLNQYKDLLFHEFKHYFCFCCTDEMKGNYYTAGGISSKNGYEINLKFLEESLAEEYSAKCSNRSLSCYNNQYEILNTLRLVMSMQQDYSEDNILKYQLLHNPIALLKQFPVYDNNEVYYKNIIMLECFNELLMNNDSYQKNLEEYETTNKSIIFIKQEAYQNLLNYSMCELNRMFFSNLVAFNEINNVSLDYNLFLIELYKKQNKKNINILSTIELDNSVYTNNYNECYKEFINYYSKKQNISIEYIESYHKDYKLRLPNNYPEYVSEDRIKLYSFLYNEEINKKENVLILK